MSGFTLLVEDIQILAQQPDSSTLLEKVEATEIIEVGIPGPPGPPGGGGIAQTHFAVTVAQADFVLPGNPVGGICLFSLNGVLQHEYVCLGNTVSIDPPAEAGDSVMITWWQYA